MNNELATTVSIPILLLVAGLLLVLGVVAILAIVLVAKRCKKGVQQDKSDQKADFSSKNAWEEAGSRVEL